MSNALRDALAQELGIDPNAVSDAELQRIKAAMKRINIKLVGVAERHDDTDTVAIIEALELGLPTLLRGLEDDPARARAFMHAHNTGDTSVTYPGLQPATQTNGVTPAAALGAGPSATSPAPDAQDPLVAEFARLLQNNREAATSMLDFIRDTVSLKDSSPAQHNLLVLAITRMVAAATKDPASLDTEERKWVLVDNGGEPEPQVQRDARQALTQAQGQVRNVETALREIAGHDDVLNAAESMADMVARGQRINASEGSDLKDALNDLRTKISRATPRTPRAARPPRP